MVEFSRRAPFTGRTGGRGSRVRVATDEWMDRRRITEPPPLLPVSPPVIETVLFPFVRISPRFPRLRPRREKGFTSSLFFILSSIDQTNSNFSFLFASTKWFKRDSKSYLSIKRIEPRFRILFNLLLLFDLRECRDRQEVRRKFEFTKATAKERVATGLTAFSRASCACALSHATRSLARQPIITALATARVRASLSPRKAADQVNIANRCIVASVNSISRPTDPADSALSSSSTSVIINPRFLFLFREKKDLSIELKKFTEAGRFIARVRYSKITEVEPTVCHAF